MRLGKDRPGSKGDGKDQFYDDELLHMKPLIFTSFVDGGLFLLSFFLSYLSRVW